MSLSDRLSCVKNMVIQCDTACDIGCDHGFVSIELVKTGVAKRVIACDINRGPLEAAAGNISAANLSDRIETRLGDGLNKIKVSDNVEAIIIAGMGGGLMAKILEEGKAVVAVAKQLVLQPQSENFLVRKWLRENGYTVVKEQMLVDMGKTYVIIDARPGEYISTEPSLTELYDTYSEYLIKNKDEILKAYLIKSIEINSGYLFGIDEDKRGALNKKINLMKQALSMME